MAATAPNCSRELAAGDYEHRSKRQRKDLIVECCEKQILAVQRAYVTQFGRPCRLDEVKILIADDIATRMEDDERACFFGGGCGSIDAMAQRAFEAWGKVMLSEIMVAVEEEWEIDSLKEEECSICFICLRRLCQNSETLVTDFLAKSEEEEKCDGVVVRLARCAHYFHRECVVKWIASVPSCPLCRTCPVDGTFYS